jgi:hypothetical protein
LSGAKAQEAATALVFKLLYFDVEVILSSGDTLEKLK